MPEDRKVLVHNLVMENREKLSVSGVIDVDSFCEDSIILYTDMGTLTIKGGNLHINKLSVDTGDLMINGDVDSLVYSNGIKNKGEGMFAKLFK